jgi:hypothetical protein
MRDTSLEAQRQVIIKWLNKTLELETGEEYYLQIHAKDEQKRLLKMIRDEIKIMEKVDPIGASQIYAKGVFKDKRFWVVLRKVAVSFTSVGFKKDLSGEVKKVELEHNSEEIRRLSLMRQDRMSWEEIEEMEGAISHTLKEIIDGS